jgi:hypothetical protein
VRRHGGTCSRGPNRPDSAGYHGYAEVGAQETKGSFEADHPGTAGNVSGKLVGLESVLVDVPYDCYVLLSWHPEIAT